MTIKNIKKKNTVKKDNINVLDKKDNKDDNCIIDNNTKKKNNVEKEKDLKNKENSKFINYKSNLHTLGKILASPNKKKILFSLTIPLTPKDISKKTNLSFPTVSKNIKELEDLGIINIENKDLKKGRIVVIKETAKIIVSDLEKRKQDKNNE